MLLLQGSSSATDETVIRYSSQYDQKLDPFTSFSKRERLRKYMDLRPYDKITLGMVSSGVMFGQIAMLCYDRVEPRLSPLSL